MSSNLLFLTTGLEQIMRNSRDSEELLTVWEGWRHVTGSDIRKQFKNLTTYLNKAVQYNGKTKYSTGENPWTLFLHLYGPREKTR